jgi:hypothetical protein
MIRDSGKVLHLKFCRFLNGYKRYPLGHDLRTIKTISRFSTDSEPNLPSSNNSIVPKGSSTIKYNQPAFGKSHQPKSDSKYSDPSVVDRDESDNAASDVNKCLSKTKSLVPT